MIPVRSGGLKVSCLRGWMGFEGGAELKKSCWESKVHRSKTGTLETNRNMEQNHGTSNLIHQ